jgi:hypothetical protein
MPDLVIRLERWKAESVLELCDMEGLDESILTALRAALDSPPVEEGSEYRVMAKYSHQAEMAACGATKDRRLAEAIVRGTEETREHIEACWLQSRITTTLSDGSSLIGPWTDLPSEEGER